MKRHAGGLLVAVLLLVLSSVVGAQVYGPDGKSLILTLLNEGSAVGSISSINCVGAGIACTTTSGTGTVTVNGGGGAAWGDITGTLSNQTDLQAALNGKEAAGTFSGVGSCDANQWASTLNDGAAPTCTQPSFSNLSGSATDNQVPNNITVDLATLATTATTANAGDSATSFFSSGTIEVARGGTGAAPGADDQVLVSDSTSAATWRGLPSGGTNGCSGTNDKPLYNSSTNTWSCGTDQTGGGGGTTYVILGAPVGSTASNAYQNITGLSWSVLANTRYDIECHINYNASAATIGIGIGWDGPASPTQTSGRMVSGISATTVGGTVSQGDDTGSFTSASAGTAGNHADFDGFWHNGANAGTLQMRFRPETATLNGITILAGSFCKYDTYN